MIGLLPAAWHDLFTAVAAASAALLGLFFVAFSLHLRDIESNPILRNRARTNVQALVTALVQALSVLIPGQGNAWLGVEIAIVNVLYLLLVTAGVWRTLRSRAKLTAAIWLRLSLNPILVLLGVVGGASLVLDKGPGMFLLVPGVFVRFPVITYNAWAVLFPPELRRGQVHKT